MAIFRYLWNVALRGQASHIKKSSGLLLFTEGTVLKDLFEIKLSKSTRVGCKLSLSTWDRATEGEEAHSWTAFLGIGACRRTESLRP